MNGTYLNEIDNAIEDTVQGCFGVVVRFVGFSVAALMLMIYVIKVTNSFFNKPAMASFID